MPFARELRESARMKRRNNFYSRASVYLAVEILRNYLSTKYTKGTNKEKRSIVFLIRAHSRYSRAKGFLQIF
jgi:hypothetical protein